MIAPTRTPDATSNLLVSQETGIQIRYIPEKGILGFETGTKLTGRSVKIIPIMQGMSYLFAQLMNKNLCPENLYTNLSDLIKDFEITEQRFKNLLKDSNISDDHSAMYCCILISQFAKTYETTIARINASESIKPFNTEVSLSDSSYENGIHKSKNILYLSSDSSQRYNPGDMIYIASVNNDYLSVRKITKANHPIYHYEGPNLSAPLFRPYPYSLGDFNQGFHRTEPKLMGHPIKKYDHAEEETSTLDVDDKITLFDGSIVTITKTERKGGFFIYTYDGAPKDLRGIKEFDINPLINADYTYGVHHTKQIIMGKKDSTPLNIRDKIFHPITGKIVQISEVLAEKDNTSFYTYVQTVASDTDMKIISSDLSIEGEIKKGFYYTQKRFFIKQLLKNAHFSVGDRVQFADDSVKTIKDVQAHGPNVHYFYDGDLVNVNAVAGRAIKRVIS